MSFFAGLLLGLIARGLLVRSDSVQAVNAVPLSAVPEPLIEQACEGRRHLWPVP